MPDSRRWAAQFLQAVVEMLAGRRSADQLRQCATASAISGFHSAAACCAEQPVPADALRSVHVGVPAGGVAEVCAVVRLGNRHRALAARMEVADGRWQCVTLQLL